MADFTQFMMKNCIIEINFKIIEQKPIVTVEYRNTTKCYDLIFKNYGGNCKKSATLIIHG